MKLWKKRWFVLSDLCLFYYRGENTHTNTHTQESRPPRGRFMRSSSFAPPPRHASSEAYSLCANGPISCSCNQEMKTRQEIACCRSPMTRLAVSYYLLASLFRLSQLFSMSAMTGTGCGATWCFGHREKSYLLET